MLILLICLCVSCFQESRELTLSQTNIHDVLGKKIGRMPQDVSKNVLEQMKVLHKTLPDAVLVHFYRKKFNTCHTSYEFDAEKGCLQEVQMECIVRRSKGETVKVLGPHYVQSHSEALGSKVAGTNHAHAYTSVCCTYKLAC